MDKINKFDANAIKLVPFSDFKKKALRDPEIKAEYDRLGPEYEIIEAIIRKRLEKGLSQKQLAEKMGTKQSALSRLESGNYNPSLAFLKKVATALDAKLQIQFR